VVFDIGGVMINLAQGWEETLTLAGVLYRPFAADAAFMATYTVLEHGLESGALAPEIYFREIQALIGGDYTLEELRAGFMAIIREEFAGIGEIVRGLKAKGIRTACLSNTSPPHWPVLTDPARYPSIAALDAHFASHLLGACKPDPAAYHAVETAMAVRPSDILFFDDRPVNVEGARACGWQAEVVRWEQPSALQVRKVLEGFLGEL
jgi:FMN phosphatase YigB (HAD superfamily)